MDDGESDEGETTTVLPLLLVAAAPGKDIACSASSSSGLFEFILFILELMCRCHFVISFLIAAIDVDIGHRKSRQAARDDDARLDADELLLEEEEEDASASS